MQFGDRAAVQPGLVAQLDRQEPARHRFACGLPQASFVMAWRNMLSTG
jgi:hypothetical protein